MFAEMNAVIRSAKSATLTIISTMVTPDCFAALAETATLLRKYVFTGVDHPARNNPQPNLCSNGPGCPCYTATPYPPSPYRCIMLEQLKPDSLSPEHNSSRKPDSCR